MKKNFVTVSAVLMAVCFQLSATSASAAKEEQTSFAPNLKAIAAAQAKKEDEGGQVDPDTVKTLAARAQSGDHEAEFELGQLYDRTVPPRKDPSKYYEQAMPWYQKASDAGLPKAQFALALLYETGGSGKKDGVKAVDLYKKAACSSNVEAESRLASLYQSGHLVLKDGKQAFYWATKAAAGGNANAQAVLQSLKDPAGQPMTDKDMPADLCAAAPASDAPAKSTKDKK